MFCLFSKICVHLDQFTHLILIHLPSLLLAKLILCVWVLVGVASECILGEKYAILGSLVHMGITRL